MKPPRKNTLIPADAVGKMLTLNDTLLYKVTGVIKDIPNQSHITFDFLLSMNGLQESKEDAWLSNNFNTYILLKQGASIEKLNAKLPAMVSKYVGGQIQAAVHMTYEQLEKGGSYFRLTTAPLRDIHLKSNRVGELRANGNIQYVYIFSICRDVYIADSLRKFHEPEYRPFIKPRPRSWCT
jgi:putative ABC transport system permease protein